MRIKNTPSVNNWDFTSIPELTILAGKSHATKSSTTKVEMCSVRRAARALIRYYNRHCPLRTYALVQTFHLITLTAPFSTPIQPGSHRSYSCLQRLHVHQRSITTRPSLTNHNYKTNYYQLPNHNVLIINLL